MAHWWRPRGILLESNALLLQTMSLCHLRADTIITPEYLSLEHDFFRGLLAHHLENCLRCFIHGNETNYRCNCTYLKAIFVVRIAMLLAPAVYMQIDCLRQLWLTSMTCEPEQYYHWFSFKSIISSFL